MSLNEPVAHPSEQDSFLNEDEQAFQEPPNFDEEKDTCLSPPSTLTNKNIDLNAVEPEIKNKKGDALDFLDEFNSTEESTNLQSIKDFFKKSKANKEKSSYKTKKTHLKENYRDDDNEFKEDSDYEEESLDDNEDIGRDPAACPSKRRAYLSATRDEIYTSDQDQESEGEDETKEDNEDIIQTTVSHWNLTNYYAPLVSKFFKYIIGILKLQISSILLIDRAHFL